MDTITLEEKKRILEKRLAERLAKKKTTITGDTFLDQRLPFFNQRRKQLDELGYNFFEPTIWDYNGAWISVEGRKMLMMASYSYLDLIGHPRINAAASNAIEQYGTGSHGVRILAGTLPVHRELEKTIADFKRAEDAMVFSSGYTANLATISTLCGLNDIIICDSYNHASIVDGCKLSQSKTIFFDHNDMTSLEEKLQQAGTKGKLVIVDGVFSMDGDVADLPKIHELCKKYNAALMVDEAHSTGIIGKTGHGVEEHFGLDPDTIDIKMGTLSKTIPAIGGYIAGKKDLISALKANANAFFFSASLAPHVAAAANEAIKVIEDEPKRVQKLHENVKRYHEELLKLGFATLASTTAIVPIICHADEIAFEMTRICQEEGVFVLPVLYPAVPVNLPRLRTTVTTAHTAEDIDFSISVFEKAGKLSGLL